MPPKKFVFPQVVRLRVGHTELLRVLKTDDEGFVYLDRLEHSGYAKFHQDRLVPIDRD